VSVGLGSYRKGGARLDMDVDAEIGVNHRMLVVLRLLR
jgi:hypothetical protein